MALQTIEIADGVITIRSEVDESELRRNARRAGDDYEREFNRAVRDRADNDKSMLSRVFSGIGESIRGGLTSVLTGVLPVLGAVSNAVLAFSPIIVHAAVVVGQFSAAALAAAPILLSLGTSAMIALQVIKGFGPELGKSISPITKAFQEAEESAAKVASRGVRPLAQEFVKLNMPVIRGMLNNIAMSTNDVVKGFIAWTNTASGMEAVRNISEGTAVFVSKLSYPLWSVAQSFTAMIGRISILSAKVGGDGLGGLLMDLAHLFDRITADTVQGGLDSLSQAFQAMAKFGRDTVTVIGTVWDLYKKWKVEIGLVSDALGIMAIVFGGPVTAIIAAIGLVIRHFDEFKALILGAQGWFSGLQGGSDILARLKDQVMLVWEAIKNAGDTIWAMVQGPLAQLWADIQQKLLPAFGNWLIALGPIVTFLINVLGPAIGFVLGFLVQYIDVVVQVIAACLNFQTAILSSGPIIVAAYQAVVAFFQALPGRIGGALSALPGQIAALFGFVADKMLYATGYMIGATIKFFIDLPGRAANAVSSLWTFLSGAFTHAGNNAKIASSNLVIEAVNALQQLPYKAVNAIISLPSQLWSVFSGAGTWLWSAGYNIVIGLVNGMQGAIGAAVNAAVGAAKSVINGLKAGLGINSPSKVAEEEVGAYVMPGVAKGITKSVPAFESEVQGVAPVAATSAVASTAAATGTATGGGLQIGSLTLQLKGLLDPNDPGSWRRMIAQLYDALHSYEKSYA